MKIGEKKLRTAFTFRRSCIDNTDVSQTSLTEKKKL